MKTIVIVESPSKSATIESYVGSDFKVVASNGHIRDLATKGKGGLGIDIPAGFIPRYEIKKESIGKVAELRYLCEGCDVYLATDPDREGEAISWHLAEVLDLDVNTVKRVEFNEITKPAVLEAFANPRHIDLDLVSSQETRRMLDRIIGFQLSTLMQRKIKTKSAGRVQSAVLKVIVDLEKEILAFVSEPYYEISVQSGKLKLDLIDEKNNKAKLVNKNDAEKILASIPQSLVVNSVTEHEAKRESKAPLITSTLQQEASTKLGFSPDRTMRAAQSLYEGKEIGGEHAGLITYMRTDSTRLSDVFQDSLKKYITDKYGKEYLGYLKQGKKKDNIQDAHEAIRPTSLERTPELMQKYLSSDEAKIYKLIYNRAISSMMAPAKFLDTTVIFTDGTNNFKVTGQKMIFDGFLKVYGLSDEDKNKLLPKFEANNIVNVDSKEMVEEFTKPKARFTEATIIKMMEDLGIGRPSTYAQTIERLKTSKYIEIKEKKIFPTEAGMLSIEKLDEFFSEILDSKYTADMETTLDQIAGGEANSVIELQKFYDDFYPQYQMATKNMSGLKATETGEFCPLCGKPLVVRQSKFGNFVACSNYPECKYKKVDEKKEAPEETGILCPNCLKGHIVSRDNRGKKFYACDNFPKCRTTFTYKPVTEYCPTCGAMMMESPDGLVCSNKDCTTVNKEVETEQKELVLCPNCKKGHLVMRTAAKGRSKGNTFYACDNFPKCRTTFSDEPLNETCGVCGGLMVNKDGKKSCSNQNCDNFIK